MASSSLFEIPVGAAILLVLGLSVGGCGAPPPRREEAAANLRAALEALRLRAAWSRGQTAVSSGEASGPRDLTGVQIQDLGVVEPGTPVSRDELVPLRETLARHAGPSMRPLHTPLDRRGPGRDLLGGLTLELRPPSAAAPRPEERLVPDLGGLHREVLRQTSPFLEPPSPGAWQLFPLSRPGTSWVLRVYFAGNRGEQFLRLRLVPTLAPEATRELVLALPPGRSRSLAREEIRGLELRVPGKGLSTSGTLYLEAFGVPEPGQLPRVLVLGVYQWSRENVRAR